MSGATAAIAATAAVVGTGLSAYSMISNAQNQSAAAGYNSRVAEVNAEEANAAATSDAAAIRRKGAMANASLAATAAAAGLVPNEGSPYEVLLGNAQQTELEAQRRLFQGKLQAQGSSSQATLYGNLTNPTGGYLAGGAQLIGGGIKAYQLLNGGSSGSATSVGTGTGGTAP